MTPARSLDLELWTAQSALAAGRPKLACAALGLFVVEVRLLPPAAIQPADAVDLITAAKRIEQLLGCTTHPHARHLFR